MEMETKHEKILPLAWVRRADALDNLFVIPMETRYWEQIRVESELSHEKHEELSLVKNRIYECHLLADASEDELTQKMEAFDK